MPHPKCRTWTLASLDRDRGYRLWFDPMTDRWEVAYADGDTAPLTTRATLPRAAARAQAEGVTARTTRHGDRVGGAA